jgi:replicative superfamily II helicase
MASDWMASGFAFDPGPSEDRAQALIEATGWRGWWNPDATPAQLLGSRPLRAAQEALLQLSLDERLVVVEAPTGTGKTEAALIWASRLAQAGLVDGLYFAVPTRSAATELHARISRLMTSSHPRLRGKVVRAVPGMLDVDDSRPD